MGNAVLDAAHVARLPVASVAHVVRAGEVRPLLEGGGVVGRRELGLGGFGDLEVWVDLQDLAVHFLDGSVEREHRARLERLDLPFDGLDPIVLELPLDSVGRGCGDLGQAGGAGEENLDEHCRYGDDDLGRRMRKWVLSCGDDAQKSWALPLTL